jgi:predicted AAA+ superfamily ATPase
MSYIPRIQELKLLQFLEIPSPARNVLLVEGARQVGKTTLITTALGRTKLPVITINLEQQKRLLQKIDSCVEFSDFETVIKTETGFNPEIPSVLFIDEAQESMQLGGYVRFMKEKWAESRVILSGSTLNRLFRPNQRFPVGRITRLLITPLSFTEYLRCYGKESLIATLKDTETVSGTVHKILLEELNTYLETGGLPAIVIARLHNEPWQTYRKEIMADYADDFRRIFGEERYGTVQSCFRAVAQLAGNPFSNTTVQNSLTSRQNEEINNIFGRLEEWHMVLKAVQQGPANTGSSHYHPKMYLFDTGLLRDQREQSAPTLNILDNSNPIARINLGGVIENQTAIELSRNGESLSGWKKSSVGTEIDFIVKSGQGAIPVECKAALKVKGTHLKGLIDYMNLYQISTGYTVSLAPFEEQKRADGKTVINIPLYSAETLLSRIFS